MRMSPYFSSALLSYTSNPLPDIASFTPRAEPSPQLRPGRHCRDPLATGPGPARYVAGRRARRIVGTERRRAWCWAARADG